MAENLRYWLPDGFRVAAYVGATTSDFRSLIPPQQLRNIVPDIDAGLSRVKAGHGDTVMVLPDYSEDVAGADHFSSLRAGTRIVGMGYGALRPSLTWTAAAATFLFDQANVELSNFRLNFASSGNSGVTVAAPMTWSADGCGLVDCDIFFGDDADDNVDIGILVEDAADCYMMNCHAIGATAAECTSFLDLHNADRWKMWDTIIEGATDTTTVGVMRFVSEASLNIDLRRNTYINRLASSAAAVTGLAGVSGVSRDEHFAYLDTTSLTPWVTSTGLMTFHRPTVSNTAGETGTETVGTVSA